MNIADTTAPKSDQQNFDDYAAGVVKTVTVDRVTPGGDEQPVDVHLVEFPGRPFRPSKSMRRVMVAAWGSDSSVYAGRRMTLYGDPSVKFGGQTVGGIRISEMSHIDKPLTVALTVTRGKRSPFRVQPLNEQPTPAAATGAAEPTAEDVAACTDVAALKGMWRVSSPDRRKEIEFRVAELQEPAADDVAPTDTEPDPHDGNDPWVTT